MKTPVNSLTLEEMRRELPRFQIRFGFRESIASAVFAALSAVSAHGAWRDVVDCFAPQSVMPEIPEEIYRFVSNNIGGRGGGQTVKLKSGKFRFLDRLTPEELKEIVPPIIPRGTFAPRCDKSSIKLLTITDDEKEAIERILGKLREKNPTLAHLIRTKIDEVKDWGVEVRFDLSAAQGFDQWKDSTRIDKVLQRPVAMLTGDFFIVQEPIRSRLPLDDRVAIFVHEALRQTLLEHEEGSDLLLSLDEIEESTRSIVSTGEPGPVAKRLPLEKVRELAGLLSSLSSDFDRLERESQEGRIDIDALQVANRRFADFGKKYQTYGPNNKDNLQVFKLAGELGFSPGLLNRAHRISSGIDERVRKDPARFIPDSKARGSTKDKLDWWYDHVEIQYGDMMNSLSLNLRFAASYGYAARKGGKFSEMFLDALENDPTPICQRVIASLAVPVTFPRKKPDEKP